MKRKLRNALSLVVQQLLFWIGCFAMYMKCSVAEAEKTVTGTACNLTQGLLLFAICCGIACLLNWMTDEINEKEADR